MKLPYILKFKLLAFGMLFFILPSTTFSCTIISAIAKNGHVWNANNEDGPFGVGNFINVFPKTENSKYGYFTLSYLSPRYGNGGSLQGGTNEAGLTFDFNQIKYVEDFEMGSKVVFPAGNDAILPHILANMASVDEVVAFFETYWFEDGFRGAQMHVADRNGKFAMISASGFHVAKPREHLVSTNFDICGDEAASSCWRYPIAKAMLKESAVNLATMTQILEQTAQKNGGTMYSNIQNLTTGELWFFSKHDPNNKVGTTIKDLLAKGKYSYSFNDLGSLLGQAPKAYEEPSAVAIPTEQIEVHEGVYGNGFIGKVHVEALDEGIKVSFEDGFSFMLSPKAEDSFYWPNEGVVVQFSKDFRTQRAKLLFYENGMWSFDAKKEKNGSGQY